MNCQEIKVPQKYIDMQTVELKQFAQALLEKNIQRKTDDMLPATSTDVILEAHAECVEALRQDRKLLLEEPDFAVEVGISIAILTMRKKAYEQELRKREKARERRKKERALKNWGWK